MKMSPTQLFAHLTHKDSEELKDANDEDVVAGEVHQCESRSDRVKNMWMTRVWPYLMDMLRVQKYDVDAAPMACPNHPCQELFIHGLEGILLGREPSTGHEFAYFCKDLWIGGVLPTISWKSKSSVDAEKDETQCLVVFAKADESHSLASIGNGVIVNLIDFMDYFGLERTILVAQLPFSYAAKRDANNPSSSKKIELWHASDLQFDWFGNSVNNPMVKIPKEETADPVGAGEKPASSSYTKVLGDRVKSASKLPKVDAHSPLGRRFNLAKSDLLLSQRFYPKATKALRFTVDSHKN